MKMSDMFHLPLVGSESPFVRDSSGNCVIYAQSKLNDISELERVSRAKHAVHAINNHDKLTEQNAKLVEMLNEIIKEADYSYALDVDLYDSANQLLTEIKEQNNDSTQACQVN